MKFSITVPEVVFLMNIFIDTFFLPFHKSSHIQIRVSEAIP